MTKAITVVGYLLGLAGLASLAYVAGKKKLEKGS